LSALAVLVLLASAVPAPADTVVAARTIRSLSLIGAEDLALVAGEVAGAATRLNEVVGLEARVILYPGRPIRLDQLGMPAVVERNQVVTLLYQAGGLTIETEGRALARAGVGDSLRVMNLASKKTVTGRVRDDGAVEVGGN
jgi:flagella basal body P-ring formation protein FlgA